MTLHSKGIEDILDEGPATKDAGRQFAMGGLYNHGQPPGEITGSGPGFEEAMQKHNERQKQLGLPGKWRHNRHRNNGQLYDNDYRLIDWL